MLLKIRKTLNWFVNKQQSMVWLFLTILICMCSMASGEARRKVDCRKYVFAPSCRGIAAKRDISEAQNLIKDINKFPLSDEEYTFLSPEPNKLWKLNVIPAKDLLGALIRKIGLKDIDYDTGTYMK